MTFSIEKAIYFYGPSARAGNPRSIFMMSSLQALRRDKALRPVHRAEQLALAARLRNPDPEAVESERQSIPPLTEK